MSEPVDIRTVWDAAEVGDATPPRRRGSWVCGLPEAQGRPTVSPAGYMCNREDGHSGQHVAVTWHKVVAVWPQDGAP